MNDVKNQIFLMPSRLFFILSVSFLVLGGAVFFIDSLFFMWAFSVTVFLFFLIIDLFLFVKFTDRLNIKRNTASYFAQGESVKVKLIIKRDGNVLFPSSLSIYDLYPETASANIFPAEIGKNERDVLSKTGEIIFEYSLIANERGHWVFSGIDLMLGSPLRIWKMRVTQNIISTGRTYPNFRQMARGTEIKFKGEKGEIRKIRKRGMGMEFESLRDFQEGDSIRLIDWRATSRTRRMDGSLKLIVKNYQEEQDQQILFIIDSGYRLPDMYFDSALDAMLLLSYIVLKHGDAVAASSFGSHDLWIPPRKGMKAYTNLMNGLCDLHSDSVPSSPFLALESALSRLHRRSLIVLISNFREEDDKHLSWILPRIEKRHLLLLVSFRESEAEKLAFSKQQETDESVLETAAAFAYLANRRRLYRKWEHSGLLVLETSPQQITSALINKYLKVKRAGLL